MKPIEREIIEFSILKELSYNDNIPTFSDYNISEDTFVSLFDNMIKSGLLNPEKLTFNVLGSVEIENDLSLVTSKGIDFVESHEAWNKIYNDLNDLSKLMGKENNND